MSKQKYEEEIEEILRKYDDEKARAGRQSTEPGEPGSGERGSVRTPRPPVDLRTVRASRTPQKSFTVPDWKRLSAGQYILMAFGAALLAVLVARVSDVLAGMFIIASAILFVIPFILYRSTGTTSGGYSPHEEKRWRGQPIDYTPRRDPNTPNDPLEGIKRWLRRK